MSKTPLTLALGAAVRRRREALGVSQEAFADTIGMHRTQFGAVEQGRKDCQLSTLKRISDGLGMPLWRLVKDIGSSATEDLL